MPSIALGFLCGTLCILLFTIPPPIQYLLILFFALLFAYLLNKNLFLLFMLSCCAGLLWVDYHAVQKLSWALPKHLEGKTIHIKGIVATIPEIENKLIKFNFFLTAIKEFPQKKSIQQYVHLYWRKDQIKLFVGDEYELVVRLKRIRSFLNPGGIDYEAIALEKGIRARGYVLDNQKNKLITHYQYAFILNQLRQYLNDRLSTILPQDQHAHWLRALTIGERSGIPQDQWQVLRKTGTNHLMAIAGLHLGMLGLLIHMLIKIIWRKLPKLGLFMPAHHAAGLAALCIVFIYSLIAGLSIPTQRASIMFAVASISIFSKVKINHVSIFLCALFIVLLCHPLSILNNGFWLSFITIFILIYGMQGRLKPKGWWWRCGRAQWVITLGLLPMTLLLFKEYSFLGFVANAIAIPWVTIIILPLCMMALITMFFNQAVATSSFWLANYNLNLLWQYLTWLSSFQISAWHFPIYNNYIFFGLLIGILFLLLPKGLPGRGFSLFLLFPIILFKPQKPATGEVWLTMLDVGQGLAMVVQTKNHLLLYDAGIKLNSNYDMGELVVLPYLRHIHADLIDYLVISHGDLDHIGGAPKILQNMAVKSIKTSVPEKFTQNHAELCKAGDEWEWDHVKFKFLYPFNDTFKLGNDSSCVLQVISGDIRFLLTGDIEKFAEKQLLNKHIELKTTILSAPHHGSKTSGLKQFIQTTQPKWVLYSVGYKNRYHFPHPSVIAAYEAFHVHQLQTDHTGAIQFKTNKNNLLPPDIYRIQKKQFWHQDI